MVAKYQQLGSREKIDEVIVKYLPEGETTPSINRIDPKLYGAVLQDVNAL